MLIAAASVVISLGLAPVITLATELIVGSAPPEQAGAATGTSETSGELGGALGIAILGSIGVAVYRTESRSCSRPGSRGGGRRGADTLGGALAIAQSLPGDLGAALVAAAQMAFVDALHFVAAVAAILAAATASSRRPRSGTCLLGQSRHRRKDPVPRLSRQPSEAGRCRISGVGSVTAVNGARCAPEPMEES